MSELPNNCGGWCSIEKPTAGQWLRKVKTDEHGFYWWRECSECGSKPLLNRWNHNEELSNFCPSCGAKMKGDEKEYELATEQMEHNAMYEPTYNSEDGSL